MDENLMWFLLLLGIIIFLLCLMLLTGKIDLYGIVYADRSIDSKVFWDRFFAFVIIYIVIIIMASLILLF